MPTPRTASKEQYGVWVVISVIAMLLVSVGIYAGYRLGYTQGHAAATAADSAKFGAQIDQLNTQIYSLKQSIAKYTAENNELTNKWFKCHDQLLATQNDLYQSQKDFNLLGDFFVYFVNEVDARQDLLSYDNCTDFVAAYYQDTKAIKEFRDFLIQHERELIPVLNKIHWDIVGLSGEVTASDIDQWISIANQLLAKFKSDYDYCGGQ